MNRTETACWALVAAAFVLAGLLVARLGDTWARPAEAAMVLADDTFSLMTAQTSTNEESLFVLDGYNQRLLIYRLDLARRQLELSAAADLTQMFAAGGNGERGAGRVAR